MARPITERADTFTALPRRSIEGHRRCAMLSLLDSLQQNCPQATPQYFAARRERCHAYQRPLIDLILDSPENLRRSREPWVYKTIAQSAAEAFACLGAHWARQPNGLLRDDFVGEAARLYGERLFGFLNTVNEGAKLFVLMGNEYVEGDSSNADWSFVHSLVDRGDIDARPVYENPSWATELYLNYENLRLVRAIFRHPSSDEQEFAYQIRRAALRAYYDVQSPSKVETPRQHYPEELGTAIEAYEAVSRDPAATARQTPKGALTAWLTKYKPELTANARERIATIANWQPQGGAPKTPG